MSFQVPDISLYYSYHLEYHFDQLLEFEAGVGVILSMIYREGSKGTDSKFI